MNFTELLEQYHVPYKTEGHHHCRPGWVQIDCPFCGQDSQKFHMGYSLAYHYINCWSCGAHSVPSVLVELLHITYREARKLLQEVIPERVREQVQTRGDFHPPYGVGMLQDPHKRYLRGRGFKPAKIQELWQVRGISLAPRLQWRLYIPITYRGKDVSWTTRSISKQPDVPRYLSASTQEESIPHKSLLYGEDYARHAIVVCEGPIDVWAIGPGAVATFGLSVTNEQIERMSKYPVRAICMDDNHKAQKVAKRLVNTLSNFPGDTFNVQLNAKDAAEASKQEINQLRKEILS